MHIALDVDGVLADLAGMIIKVYREETGVTIDRSMITEWEFWHKLSMTRQQFMDMIVRAWSRWIEIQPLEHDLSEDVEALSKVGVVDILTQRPVQTIDFVKQWLKHHNIRYRSFTWVPLKTSKATFVYDVYIDDSPRLAEKLQNTNRLMFLYEQPWNRNVNSRSNIIRVKSLDEVVERLACL
ncbi:MAG: hypothetical protein QW544_02350 [Candidatus Caldarchaeum sp.]